MKSGVLFFALACGVALLLACAPGALADGDPAEVVTVGGLSGCYGFIVQTLDGNVTGCVPAPAGTQPEETQIGAAADGSIVFSDTNQGDGGGGGPIWLTSPSASPVELDSSPYDFDPSISWDGSKVVFARWDAATGSSDLYTVASDGSDLTLVASGGGINLLRIPEFSPDGEAIAYVCGPADNEPGQAGCGPLTDGSYRDSGVMRMNADGTDERMIVIGAGAADQLEGPNSLSWSPDAQWLTMDGRNEDVGNQQVFMYHSDGSDLFDNLDPTRQVTHETDLFGAWLPQFCGDGTHILFLKTVDDSGNEGDFSFLIDSDGTGRQELTLSSDGNSWGTCVLPATGDPAPPLVDMTHITVPSVDTLDVGAATSQLEADNLTVGTVSYEYSAAADDGRVVSQSPAAGVVAHRTEKQGPSVNLVVGLGPAPPRVGRGLRLTAPVRCVVPRVKGESLKTAKQALTAAHCEVGAIERASSRTVRKGRVLSESPGAGARLHDGAKVALTVSKGKRL